MQFSGTSYSPNCIRIRADQSVTKSSTFSGHPLRAPQRDLLAVGRRAIDVDGHERDVHVPERRPLRLLL